MLRRRAIMGSILAGALACFVAGLVHLFQLRFDAGDVYPAYSSFRADPLGAKMLYESLQSLPGLKVSRFFQSSAKLDAASQPVLLLIGVQADDLVEMSALDYRALHRFLLEGGRVVISLLPDPGHEASAPNPLLPRESQPAAKDNKNPSKPGGANTNDYRGEFVPFLETNGIAIKTGKPLKIDDDGNVRRELAFAEEGASNLPVSISWHSAAYFSSPDGQWRTLYRCRGEPVLVERTLGHGALVLASDSYFLSNEALRAERHADLLVWLLGGRSHIMFDETHFGIEESPSVAALMRRYRLEGVMAALALLAALFVWKNTAPLVPPLDDSAGRPGAVVAGKDAGAGFVSLLRRSIAPSAIALACFDQWKAAFARDPRQASRLPEMQKIIDEDQALSPGARRPLRAYRAIHQIVNQRRL